MQCPVKTNAPTTTLISACLIAEVDASGWTTRNEIKEMNKGPTLLFLMEQAVWAHERRRARSWRNKFRKSLLPSFLVRHGCRHKKRPRL